MSKPSATRAKTVPTAVSASSASGLECRMAVLGANASTRLTPHRREVYEVLSRSIDHPTAYEVFDRVKSRSPGISLATVYNCLDHLATHGLIKQVHVDRGQSRYCANIRDHMHFHCVHCGLLVDAPPLREFLASDFWGIPDGASIGRADVTINGTCAKCARNTAPESADLTQA